MDWPLKTCLLGAALAAALRLAPSGPPALDGPPFSRAVYDSRGRFLSLTPAADGRYRLWTPLRDISPLLVEATRLRLGDAASRRPPWERWRRRAAGLLLGLRYTPDELLEAYLNRAPYGPGVVGAGAASLLYFGKNPDQLSLSEALTLSVMPDSPIRPVLGGGNPADLKRRQEARRRAGRSWLKRHPADRQARAKSVEEDPAPAAVN